MIGSVYKWIGLVVGGLCALVGALALIQGLRWSADLGSIAFYFAFAAISAVVAASSGYSLFAAGGRIALGGCMVITLIFGAVTLFTGALFYALSIDSVDPPPPALIGVTLAIGVVITIPSAIVLWVVRRRSQ